ncbi:MAG TPA: hypothetical protein VK395_23555 [Gemmataceae bacterium]|nr:hypothetical protein [Gemmataceae bacterium]
MRIVCHFLLCGVVATAGCMSFPVLRPEQKPASSATVTVPEPPRPVITPEQVNDGNARDMAGALVEELDHDAPPKMPTAPVKVANPDKGTNDR